MTEGYGTIGQLSIEHPLAWTHVTDQVYLVRSPLWGPPSLLSPAAIYIGTVVVVSGEEVLVVDPGLSYHPTTYLIPFLASIGLGAKAIRLIVNSHDHFDHVLGNDATAEVVRRTGRRSSSGPRARRRRPASWDDQDLRIGEVDLKVVYTPGHSSTAISLWWRDRGLLISGDAIQGNGTSRRACRF